MDFQPSNFVGPRQGYEFRTAEQGTGYYKRSAPVATEMPRSKVAKSDSANGPVPGLKPPLIKAGDYVLCAYYTRDIFIVKQLRKSLTKPHYWSYEISNPRLLGNYNWVAERYLVNYHPPQGELNPDRPMEWVVGEHGTLDQSLSIERGSCRDEYQPSRLLTSSAAHACAATSESGLSAGETTAETIAFQGHVLRVACTNPPLVPIRDLIALMCNMDTTDKGSLSIRNSFFDRGFEPKLMRRFAGSQFDTPVFQWTAEAIDGPGGLLEFCSESGSDRLTRKMDNFRNSSAWNELEQKVFQAAGASCAADGRDLATSNSRPDSNATVGTARQASGAQRSLSSDVTGNSVVSGPSRRRVSSENERGASGRRRESSGSSYPTAYSLTSRSSEDAFRAARSDDQTATTASLLAAAAAVTLPASDTCTSKGEDSPRARACSGGDLIGRKVAKEFKMQGTDCWFYGDVINTFNGEGKQRYYKVRFDDGDVQDFSLLELRHILVDEPTANADEGLGAVEDSLLSKPLNDSQSRPAKAGTAAGSLPASDSKDGVSPPQPPQQQADVDLLMGLVS